MEVAEDGVYGFRLIVDDVDTCYRALGVAHGVFKPVPERFKDYIAIPKANGYQSTAVRALACCILLAVFVITLVDAHIGLYWLFIHIDLP